jgi:drug/metabolite transporter (DMT)-like permease
LALVAVTAIWGWSFVAVHDALARVPPSAFVAYRFALATVTLVLFAQIRRLTKQEALAGLIAGVFLGLGFVLQTVGLATTTASNSGFITGLTVVLVPALAFVLLRVPLTRAQALSVVLAVVGLAMLTVRELRVAAGDGWTFLCAVAFAGHVLVLDRVKGRGDLVRITVVQLAVAALFGALCAVATGDGLAPPTGSSVWLALGITATGGTSLAYLTQLKAQHATSANRVALIFTAEPVFAGLFGYWLAGDRLTPLNLVGGALVLVAMLVSEFGSRWLPGET